MKKLIKRILPYLPRAAQTALRAEAERRRQAEKQLRKERSFISTTELTDKLKQLEINADVIVHASLSNIGKFELPVAGIVDTVVSSIGIEHQTLIVPALSFNTTMREYLDQCDGFDVRSARNAMGAISNIVMGMPGALRSVHPTHSVVALGKRAVHYAHGHERDSTPFGENSPYRKLTTGGGKILMFGVGLNSVTNFHVYEDLLGAALPFAVYAEKKYAVTCVKQDGGKVEVITPCHDGSLSARRECERAREFLLADGVIHSIPLGESELSLVDAKGFTVCLLKMLLKGKSIYGEVKLSGQQTSAVERALGVLA